MLTPNEYRVREDVTARKLLYNKFIDRSDYYSIYKQLYGNYISLSLFINKEDRALVINVHDNNGYTYSPFYNPDDRHKNDLVYKEVIKNYNIFMDKLVAKKILEYDRKEYVMDNAETIKIKYFDDDLERLEKISCGDWIDLHAAEDVKMKAGEFKLIKLGVAMKLPEGYEAHVVPRSSTFKNWGIIQTNSFAIIDNMYCGNNDMWRFPAYATRDTEIHKNDRICQFRIMKNQPQICFEEVSHLDGKDRGGFGSTGK